MRRPTRTPAASCTPRPSAPAAFDEPDFGSTSTTAAVETPAASSPPTTAKCDPEALAKQGATEYHLNNLTRSLERYEAAYRCAPSAIMGQRALVIACNLPNATKARLYWKRLQPDE